MRNKLGVMICFQHSKDRNVLLNEIINENYLGFVPQRYTINNEIPFDKDSFLNDVLLSERNQGIIVESNAESFHITYPAKEFSPLTLTWEFEDYGKDISFVNDFIGLEGFVCAYLYDYYDVFWQSETSISGYEIHEKDLKNLKFTYDKWDRKIIDVSKNHGRQTLLKDLWLMAAPKMWLSDTYCELVCNKSKLMGYPNSIELENGVVVITLLRKWDRINEIKVEDLRKEQERFLIFINAKNVELKLN